MGWSVVCGGGIPWSSVLTFYSGYNQTVLPIQSVMKQSVIENQITAKDEMLRYV